jgi:membrane-bound serine protease (ClpP class)
MIRAAVLILLSALLLPTTLRAQPATTQSATTAVVIPLRGEIDDFNRDNLFKRFDEAKRLGAHTIILQIDTYGGLVTAGLDISRFLKRQSDVHVIAFVADKAISAGAMIALSCDEIVMQPGAVIGDCAPIVFSTNGGLESMGAAERAKAESPILADFRDSAARNGYDPLLAEAMVSVGRAVYWVEDSQEHRRFVGPEEYAKLTADNAWKPVAGAPNPVDAPDTLLTVHADLATKLGLSKGIASAAQSLATQRGLQIVSTLDSGAGERFVGMLSSAGVRAILLIIFLQSLYLALHIPGHGAPEAVAVVSLGLLLGIPLLTGYAQWWEILIIFAGLALLAFEIFVFPGHFVSGIVGAIMVLGGLVMTFVPKEPGNLPGLLPSLSGTWSALQQGLLVVTGGLACSLFLWFWLNRYLPKLPYFNRLILNTTVGSTEDPLAATQRVAGWPLIGAVGRAVTDLRPGGAAEFFDDAISDRRITDVISDSGYVRGGSDVVVREVEGTRVVVRAV